MNPLSPIPEALPLVEAGPSSSERPPFLPIEILGKIFAWLTPRKRQTLYGSLAEKQIALRSQIRQPRNSDLKIIQDLYATITLKKAVELADQEVWKDWTPFQDFIDELVNIISKIEETPLKEELSSLLTNLTELNNKEASFYEKHADFFVALFNLSPPAFNALLRSFGEDHPFIKEASTYRYFEHPYEGRPNEKLLALAETDHFFPIHKILPLVSRGPQVYYVSNMIYTCWKNTMLGTSQKEPLEEGYREELIFFAKKIPELVGVQKMADAKAIFDEEEKRETRSLLEFLNIAFYCLIYHGCIDEARELANINSLMNDLFWEGVISAIRLHQHEGELENILVLAKQLEYSDKLCEVINNAKGLISHRKQIVQKITKMRTVDPITNPYASKRRLRCNCTIL